MCIMATISRGENMDIEIIEEKLDKLFDDAIGVKDTIWYSETETLRDAILDMISGDMIEY